MNEEDYLSLPLTPNPAQYSETFDNFLWKNPDLIIRDSDLNDD